MKLSRLGTALCIATSLGALPAAPALAETAGPIAAVHQDAVTPEAMEALARMSTYLRSLRTFQMRGDTVREEVTSNGQKVQFLGTVTYKVSRPVGLMIETAEDRVVRQFFYDGQSFTLFAPRMGYYASAPAPGTIQELLDLAYDRYEIELPLQDLFEWGTEDDRRAELTSGFRVGYAFVAGQDADQYAFRQDGLDWQIWIARGDTPLPLRVTISSVVDPRPQFEANLAWDTAPGFDSATFAFTPAVGATRIAFAPPPN